MSYIYDCVVVARYVLTTVMKTNPVSGLFTIMTNNKHFHLVE